MYELPVYLTDPIGNNAFSYDRREKTKLRIASIIRGGISDVREGGEAVFEDADESGMLRSCRGLEHFVRTEWHGTPMVIFDNHNHALYFWYEALLERRIERGATLVHIDEHSDLWENEYDLEKGGTDLESVWRFANYSCNVGNYILPAVREGLVGEVVRIEGEGDIDRETGRIIPPETSVILNLDLDFFAPELEYIPFEKKRDVIHHFARRADCITVATSPFFIDQSRAIAVLRELFDS